MRNVKATSRVAASPPAPCSAPPPGPHSAPRAAPDLGAELQVGRLHSLVSQEQAKAWLELCWGQRGHLGGDWIWHIGVGGGGSCCARITEHGLWRPKTETQEPPREFTDS